MNPTSNHVTDTRRQAASRRQLRLQFLSASLIGTGALLGYATDYGSVAIGLTTSGLAVLLLTPRA